MQVNISFDTERERVENIKKLVDALTQLILFKEGKIDAQGRPLQGAQQTAVQTPQFQVPQPQFQQPQMQQMQPMQVRTPEPKKPEQQAGGKTSGGCRVTPYEDMSKELSRIFSRG